MSVYCSVCGRGVGHGPLYRVNEKGVPGIWQHEYCQTPTQRKKIDPELKRLNDIIDGKR